MLSNLSCLLHLACKVELSTGKRPFECSAAALINGGWGVVHYNNQGWIDRCFKFGAHISSFNFELLAAAFAAIFRFLFPLAKLIYWVDDDLICRIPINNSPNTPPIPPWSYSFSMDNVLSLGTSLNISFPNEKVRDFDFKSKYIGYWWHWDTKEVKLPEDKRLSTLSLVTSMLSAPFVHITDVRSLIGKLGHCARVVPLGRKNLRALYDFQTRMEVSPHVNSPSLWKWNPSQRNVLAWWIDTLSIRDVGMKLCSQISPSPAFTIYTDASPSYGVGIIINNQYDLFKLVDNWQLSGESTRDIGWAEFIAVEIAVHCALVTFDLHDTHLLIDTDNQGVIGAWAKRSSRSIEQNEVLGRIISKLLARSCFLSLRYVPSAENPADAPSRGLHPHGFTRRQFSSFPRKLAGLLVRPERITSLYS
jgi:hypothetical protein